MNCKGRKHLGIYLIPRIPVMKDSFEVEIMCKVIPDRIGHENHDLLFVTRSTDTTSDIHPCQNRTAHTYSEHFSDLEIACSRINPKAIE